MLLLQLLERIPFFRDFNPAERLLLAESDSYFANYRTGEYLIRENEEDTALFILIRGRVAVTRNSAPNKAIALLESGSVFGEISFLTRRLRTSNVLAYEPVTVFRMDGTLFDQLPAPLRVKIQERLILLLVERLEQMSVKHGERLPSSCLPAPPPRPTPPPTPAGRELPSPLTPPPLRFAALSDRGVVRPHNEDAWFGNPESGLFLVADGMGGHAAGEVAARIVVSVLPGMVERGMEGMGDLASARAGGRLTAILASFNAHFRRQSEEEPEFRGMGSTVALALIGERHLLLGHLGDSRVYLFREDRLSRLTEDHTLAHQLVLLGQLTPGEAEAHPTGSHLTRFVGMGGEADGDVGAMGVAPGDRLLLCSDGLTAMVNEETIVALLARHGGEPEGCCRELVEAANRAGGRDNVTVVVVAVDPPP